STFCGPSGFVPGGPFVFEALRRGRGGGGWWAGGFSPSLSPPLPALWWGGGGGPWLFGLLLGGPGTGLGWIAGLFGGAAGGGGRARKGGHILARPPGSAGPSSPPTARMP